MLSHIHQHTIELADIFRDYQHLLPYAGDDEWKVINAITSCRTEKLGGYIYRCDNCHYTEILYNSCRNRHCPKCMSLARAKWILNRDTELLPVPYFHIVFTIPSCFNPLVLYNKKQMYSLLFKATSETLKDVVANPDNLGARCGFFSILHTWDQKLNLHPHIHSVIPGGGLSPDKTSWIPSRKNFFVPVKKLSRVFRGKFIGYIKLLYKNNGLLFHGNISSLAECNHFEELLNESCKTDWVVYAKPPFKGPFWVLRYLARYTNRIALSNSRIVSCRNGIVVFKWRDRKNNYTTRHMSLDVITFMQKYLLHVLPHRFVRIRYYGFMGSKVKEESITLIRQLLGETPEKTHNKDDIPSDWVNLMIVLTGEDPTVCKKCHNGHMIKIASLLNNRIRDG